MSNRIWATDATATFLPEGGQATVFAVVDHYKAECLGIHAVRPGTRFEALEPLEPLRQVVRRIFAGFHEGTAAGVALRHEHGSQYVSDPFQRELGFFGLESSPAFVYAPEGNGVIERFFRTRPVAELNEVLQRWRERYNQGWLLERHGFRSPAHVPADCLETMRKVA